MGLLGWVTIIAAIVALLGLLVAVGQLRVAVLARRDALPIYEGQAAITTPTDSDGLVGDVLAEGPREAALHVARALVALDDSCRGLGYLDSVVDSLLSRAAPEGRHSENAMQAFRERIRIRGLDPRILITQLPEHPEAAHRWLEPLGSQISDATNDSLLVLGTVITVLMEELSVDSFLGLSAACRSYLQLALAGPRRAVLPVFLNTLAVNLPPLRATSSVVALLAPSASADVALVTQHNQRLPTAAEAGTLSAAGRLDMRTVAIEMCKLPPPDPYIVGRQRIVNTIVRSMKRRMTQRHAATVFLSGQPGVGTSSVAIKAAQKMVNIFLDGVLYLDMRGLEPEIRRDARTAVRIFSEALGLHVDPAAEDDDQLFATFMAALVDRSVLLVLDNALDASHVAPLIQVPRSCGLIVTSRDRLQSYSDPALSFHVDPLPRKAAVALLASFTPNSERKAPELAQLAHLCDDVPLALRVIGARMAGRPDLDAAYLVRMLEEEVTRLDYLQAGPRAVRATIRLSYDNLDSAAKRTFRFIAAVPSGRVTAAALSHCLSEPAFQQELLLNRIVDYSLARQTILKTSTVTASTFALYELVRLFATERLSDEESATTVREFRSKYVSYLCDRLDAIVGIETPVGDELLVEDANGLDPGEFEAARHLAQQEGWLDMASRLAEGLSSLYIRRGEVSRTLEMSEALVDLDLRLNLPSHAAQHCLAVAAKLRDMGTGPHGRTDAIAQALSAARLARNIADEHNIPILLAEADFEISNLLRRLGEDAEALDAGGHAASALINHGREWAALPVIMNNYEMAMRIRDADKAIKWSREWLRLGDANADAADRMEAVLAVGRAEGLAGNYPEAMTLAAEAAAGYSSQANWFMAGEANLHVAWWVCELGKIGEAIKSLDQTFEFFQRSECKWMGRVPLINLSAIYAKQGSFEQALMTLERAEEIPILDEPDLEQIEVEIRKVILKELLASIPSYEKLSSYLASLLSKVDEWLGISKLVLDAICLVEEKSTTVEIRQRLVNFVGSRSKYWRPEPFAHHLRESLGQEPPARTALDEEYSGSVGPVPPPQLEKPPPAEPAT